MIEADVRSTSHWEDEGRRIAAALDGVPSAVILGLDPDQSARVALGIAKAVGVSRPVAIGDLTGVAMPLYEVTSSSPVALKIAITAPNTTRFVTT